jgi:NTE family protein
VELVFGASQLMMQSIIAMKLKHHSHPAVFIRPPVAGFRALDFLKIESVLHETVAVKDELKHAIDAAVGSHEQRRKAG